MTGNAKVDLVLTGGPIFLGLEAGFAEALALAGERVLAAGSAGEVEALVGPGTRVVDLRGRAAFPGINDAHQHMLLLGLERNWRSTSTPARSPPWRRCSNASPSGRRRAPPATGSSAGATTTTTWTSSATPPATSWTRPRRTIRSTSPALAATSASPTAAPWR
jgi:hypothetical protein